MMMRINTLVLLRLTFAVGSGSHTLMFLSTGRVSSQTQLEFEQITVFDDVIISKCDGVSREEQFRPRLLHPELLKRCDEARDDIFESISHIQDFTNNTVDVLQRRRGCSLSADGTQSVFDAWALNGNEFLTFNPETLTWTSKSPSSVEIKKIWDKELVRSRAFSAFLKNFCSKMVPRVTLKSVPKTTELRVFAKPAVNLDEAELLCHVTTTDPSVKSVRLIGTGATLVRGLSVMGPLPSGGESWVLRLKARISLGLAHLSYGCAVHSETHIFTVDWNGKTLDGRRLYYSVTFKFVNAIIAFIAVIALVLVISYALILLLNNIKGRRRPAAPRPRPELTEQFESFIQSSTLYPDIRNMLLSVLYGSNTPEGQRDSYSEWLQMMERGNDYDPEFYGGRVT